MKIDIKSSVIRGVQTIEKNKFDFDRSKYLNASEAASCIRKQWFDKHAPKQAEAQNWGYARRGSHGESYVIDNLRRANVPLFVGDADEALSIQDDDLKISATPDDLIVYDDEWHGLEIKTIDPRTNRANLPKLEHVTQLQIGMALVDKHVARPADVALKSGILVYMDASNFDDIIQFEVPFDGAILDRMAKRARKVLRTRNVAGLDREGKRNGGRECQSMCAFKKVCGVNEESASSRTKANRGSSFDASAVRYMEIKTAEDALKVEKASIAEDIKLGLKTRKTNKAIVGDITVTLTTRKGRTSLDAKAVKAAGIDLTPFQTVGNPSEALTVSRG
jgi:hypothetical protein